MTTTHNRPLAPFFLQVGAWLSMLSAVLTPVLFVVSLRVARPPGQPAAFLVAADIIGTMLFLLLTGLLRGFLRRNCFFAGTDRLLLLLMALNCIYAAVTVAVIQAPALEEQVRPLIAALLVAQGAGQALFGYYLKRMDYDLGGLKQPFCLLNMMTGLCVASLVLIPIGILVSAVSDVMLATILFQEAARWRKIFQQ